MGLPGTNGRTRGLSFTESFALYIQFISIYSYFYIHTYTCGRERFMGTTFCYHEAAVKRIRRKIEVEKNKSSTGVDRSSCTNNITHEHTSQCNSTNTHHHPPIQHSTHTHTHTLTHQYKRIVCFALFLKLGDTVCNTVWNLYISMLPIYIYLYKSHIYTYDLTNAGKRLLRFFLGTKKMESLSRIMTCMKSL